MTTQQIGIQLKANGAQAVITDIRKVADTMQRLDAASAIATRGLTSLAGGFRVLSGVAVTGGVVSGLTGIVRGLDALNDAADATGASLDKLAGLERLARINGGNLDQVTSAIVKLNQQLNGSDGSDSKAAIALKALGLEVDKLKQLDPADAIVQVGRALNQFADDGDKARLAQTLFGKSLRELAPLLNDIGASTGKYSVESAKAAQEAEKFAKNAAQLGFVFGAFGRSLVGPVLEGLTAYIDRVQAAQKANAGFFESFVKEGVFGEDGVFKIGKLVGERDRFRSNLSRNDISADARRFAESRVAELERQIAAEKVRQFGPAPSLDKLPAASAGRPSVAGSVADAERAAEAEKKLEATRKTSADAAKRLAEEERKRREGIAIELADQKLLLALVMQGNDVDEARLRIELARKGLTAPEIEETIRLKAAVEELIDAKKLAAEAEEAEIKRRQEIIDSAFAQEQAVAAQVKSLEEQITAQLQQNETLGLTGVALAEVEAARLRDAAAEALRRAEVLESDAVSQGEAGRVRELAARYNELADARLAGALKAADLEKAKDAIEAQQREAQQLSKIFDDVGRSLTDSLFRGFESGKSFARSFKDAIVNSFKSLVVRFIAQPVLSGITGSIAGAFGFSGAAQAGQDAAGGFGGGFLNALSGGKTIFDALSGGLTSGLTSFATTLGNAGFSSGAQFINGFSSALNGGSAASFSGASSAFNLGNFAGQAAPFLPAVFSLLQGDIKGAAFSGGGAAIGTAIGGPIGGLIGGGIGSLLGGLFGGGAKTYRNRLSGSTERGFTFNNTRGGIAGGNDALVSLATGFTNQVKGLSSILGVDDLGEILVNSGLKVRGKKSFAGFSAVINGESFSTSVGKGKRSGAATLQLLEKQVQELVRTAVLSVSKSSLTATMSEFLKAVKIEEFQAAVGKVAQLIELQGLLASKFAANADNVIKTGNIDASLEALQALLTPQELVTAQTDTLAKKFTALGLSLPSSAQGLRDLVTGIDKSTESGQKLFGSVLGLVQPFLQLQQAIDGVNGSAQAAIEALLTPQEIVQQKTDTLTKQFAALGLSLPSSAQGLRDLVTGIDKSTDSGQKLFGSVLGLVQPFLQLQQAIEFVNGSAQAAIEALLTPQEIVAQQTDVLTKAFDKLGFALPGSVEQLREYVNGIDKSTESGQKLFGSVLSLVQPFLQLQGAIEQVSGAAQAATEALEAQAIAGASSRDDALRRLAIVQNGGVLPQVPGFASGGSFGGGLRLVGENGPELEVTGPSRIYNAQQTSQMLRPANDESAGEIKALREDLRASQTAIASLQSRMVRLFERWDSTGLPEVRAV